MFKYVFVLLIPLIMLGCGNAEPGARDDLVYEPVEIQEANSLRDELKLLLAGGPDSAGVEDLPGFMENIEGYTAEDFGKGNGETFNQVKSLVQEAHQLLESGDSAGAKAKVEEALETAKKLPSDGGGSDEAGEE